MRWHKIISTVLHPIVIPTIGIILYFILIPFNLSNQQKYTILGVVFATTYVIPILLLLFLKSAGFVKSYNVRGIKERKFPVFFMMSLLFLLAKFFFKLSVIRDLSYLFYGVVFGLAFVYITLIFKIKTSLHLLSMGAATGFFLLFQQLHNIYTIPLVIVLIILSGLLGSSRLHLKAHTLNEVCLGFLVGFISPYFAFYLL